VQFRAEAFNILNHVNFAAPGQVFGASDFGVITAAADARVIQLGLKWVF
jgi:hypothetical protein